MDETDKINLITAALAMGFISIDNNKLQCTYDQLCQFCSIIAATTVEQLEETINGT